MTNLSLLDYSKVTGYLRNYDPIKQDFRLLPHNDTSRPLIVPQEYLMHYDDVLLPCSIPSQIVYPLAVFKHLVSSSRDKKDTSYHTAFSKQSHSFNELLFISANVISFLVKTEQKTTHKPTHIERHRSPSRTSQTTSDKNSVTLNVLTLCDITQKLEPYKRSPSDTHLTTLTEIIDNYERISKVLRSLELDTQNYTIFTSKTVHFRIYEHSFFF